MNLLEAKMLEILRVGKEKYNFVGIKAEFESEGSRFDEMLRIIELTRKSGLNLGIKIGGCEAVSDLYNAKLLGADYIIAPMIETPYALKKYIEVKNKVYDTFERQFVRFLFNLETKTAFDNLESIIQQAITEIGADGIVFGRVDFAGSMGYNRDKIASSEINEFVIKTSKKCQENKLDFVVGGAVSNETIDTVLKVYKVYLSRFETRKIIFAREVLSMSVVDINKGLDLAVEFELLWLKNKQNYYTKISLEDASRIKMLSARIKNQK